MKKFFVLLMLILLSVTQVSAKYYCESNEFQGVYEPDIKSACDMWKDVDFSGMYKTCVYANNLGKKAYKAGQCESIIERTYKTSDNKLCKEQITQKSGKVIDSACVGQ